MVTDIKVNYINRPINRCARVNRSFPHAALSEIGSDSHVHIPFAAMEQIQALAYQEYIRGEKEFMQVSEELRQ